MKFITNKDYDKLNPLEAIKYDKRGFFELFFFFLKRNNILFNLLFHYSILRPLWIKLILFFFQLTLMLSLSAFFFSDGYVDARAELPEKERVINDI